MIDNLFRITSKIVVVTAVAFALFQIYTAGFGVLTGTLKQAVVHLGFALTLVFLKYPTSTKIKRLYLFDMFLACLSMFICIYIYLIDSKLALLAGSLNIQEILLGTILIMLVIEATRRAVGLNLVIIAVLGLSYCFWGKYFPGIVAHRGFDLEKVLGHMVYTTEGIFGVALNASALYIAIFIMFGAILNKTGGGTFFNNLGLSLFGKVRGGPAKAAICASTLFGTVSGQAMANVAGTGTFTIPLMKKVGYKPIFAAAVESSASSGGQIMPPIMGAAAFIIAEVLSIPYYQVALSALIPALLFYLSVFVQVDLEAVKLGIKSLSGSGIPNIKETLKDGWLFILPLLMLVMLLTFLNWSLAKVAFYASISAIVIGFIRKKDRLNFSRLIDLLETGASNILGVALVCATAGIIIGTFSLTGLGLKLTNILLELSQDNLLILLILTMISSIVLGMGLPTVACYIVLAVLIAPALVQMGVEPLAAHLFILYFGVFSAVTPPVAVAAYVAAGIAGSKPMQTGFLATKMCLAAFLVPYMFVFGPQLLLIGSPADIVMCVTSATIGVIALAVAIEGYLFTNLNWLERILLLAGALMLIKPGLTTDLGGFALLTIVVILDLVKKRKQQPYRAVSISSKN